MRGKFISLTMVTSLCFLSLLLFFASSTMAITNPYTYDISRGYITISAGTNSGTIKVAYGDSKVADNISSTRSIIITGTVAPIFSIPLTVTVAPNLGTINITLENVNINISGACPFSIGSGSTVYLTLLGKNTLKTRTAFAGLDVPSGAGLDITASSTGSLTATGGINSQGIGGSYLGSSGTVTIRGGTVTATGGEAAAGIGGGGTVTIRGGTVTATGGDYGAGIGGNGCDHNIRSDAGTVIISGGTVTATGGMYAAGIGGGSEGVGDTVTISGGTVTAKGGKHGSGIGDGNHGIPGSVTISGGTVMAKGGDSSAGISCCTIRAFDFGYYRGTVIISGGAVTATGGENAAGIGGCANSDGYYAESTCSDTYCSDSDKGTVTISGGTVTAEGGGRGAGIGGGYLGSGCLVTISGSTVTAKGGFFMDGGFFFSNGIGSGYYGSGNYDRGGNLTINSGSVKANYIQPTVKNSRGTQEFCVTISGLPASAGVSYTVNGGSSVSCSTDASGKLYLWITPGSSPDVIIISANGSQYVATGEVTDSTNNFSATLDSASSLTVSSSAITSTAGKPFDVTVTAKDAYGNTATSYTGTVQFTSTDAHAVLPANYTFVSGDNGTHTFTGGVTLQTAGTQTVTATDTVKNSITGTGGSLTVVPIYSISIGTLTGGSITANPTSATSGSAITLTITPNAGMQLQAGSLKYDDGSDHTITDTCFTMPAGNVIVTAEFEQQSLKQQPGISLDKTTLSLHVGGASGTLKASIQPNYAGNPAVTWSSSEPTVAFVNGGVLTPVGAGKSIITVTTNDGQKTARCTVIVTPSPGEDEQWDERQAEQSVAGDKTWRIKFSKPVDPNSVNRQNIMVLDSQNEPVEIEVKAEVGSDNIILVIPKVPYQKGVYRLFLGVDLDSITGKSLTKGIMYRFTVK